MRNINRLFSSLMLVSLPLLLLKPAMAWDGVVTGKISQIHVTAPDSNYGFRIYLANVPSLCGNQNDWAYLNGVDSNYKVFVATLTAAKMANQTVTIYSNKEPGTGYCHIGYIITN
jgi:hypothetical protein